MRIVQNSQNFTLPTSEIALAKPALRWQTAAKWAAGIAVVALGLGLAAYAYRNVFSPSPSGTDDCSLEDIEITCTEDPEPNQIPYLQSAVNGTIPCEEGEPDQAWIVCDEASSSDAEFECAILKNVCTSGADQPRSFIMTAGSKALTCAVNAGGKAGKAALTTLGSMCCQTGKYCVKGLLIGKPLHHLLGTPDPNDRITMFLKDTCLRVLTHDCAPFFGYLGVGI
jgi:hypothetical protein